ncbi:MAG TPA: DNA-formamidopyrimidine glycosylase family protein, partial [Longimicrobium sp.]|nr:DNA-formamidopyrimidine glycosylase family protein [Longimicrobium sp.]
MPELPEVETIVRDLARLLPGSTIRKVEVYKADLIEGDTPEGFAKRIKGRKIRGVTRRAKNIVMDLGGDRLLVNLGMTGRLIVTRAGDEEPTHLGVRMTLDRGRELRYHDVRRFGRLWTMTDAEWQAWDGELGVEPLSDAFSAEWLVQAAGRSR